MTQETIKATGKLHIQLFGEDGRLKYETEVPNLIVSAGKALIASRLAGVAGNTDNAITHMAVGRPSPAGGTTTPAPSTSDVALISEITPRVALSSTVRNNNSAVVTYSATFLPGTATGSIVEAGLFNQATGGTMLCRTTHSVITKEASDTLTINWDVTIN